MGFLHHHFDGAEKDHEEYVGGKHEAELSHEVLGGAAAFAAAHEYEKYLEKNGKPDKHAKAKEILAGFAGAFIEREVESKGLDFIDKEKAKHAAKERAKRAVDQRPEEFVEINEYN